MIILGLITTQVPAGKRINGGEQRISDSDLPAKDLCDDPVIGDQRPVTERKQGAEIGTAPEKKRRNTGAGDLCRYKSEHTEHFLKHEGNTYITVSER